MQRSLFLLSLSIFSVLNLAAATPTSSQRCANSGRDFWLCFDQNYRTVFDAQDRSSTAPKSRTHFQLSFCSMQNAELDLGCVATSLQRHYTIKAGEVLRVDIPDSLMISSEGLHKAAALHLRSTEDVSVVAMNHIFQTTDSYGALSNTQLGTDYVLSCYAKLSADLCSQASIVATEDNTEIVLTLPAGIKTVGGMKASARVMLQKGDIYHLRADATGADAADLSGTRIHASKNVAVFSGHSGAYVPRYVRASNMLVEQLHPLRDWGTEFVTQELPGRTRYSLKVVASDADTKLEYRYGDNIIRRNLSASEVLDIEGVRGSLLIRSTKPLQIMQLAHGYGDGDSAGDPCMMTVLPTSSQSSSYLLASPQMRDDEGTDFRLWSHYALVVVNAADIGSLKLDGATVDTQSFHSTDGNYMVGAIPLKGLEKAALLSCKGPLSVQQYGYVTRGPAGFDCYGHSW